MAACPAGCRALMGARGWRGLARGTSRAPAGARRPAARPRGGGSGPGIYPAGVIDGGGASARFAGCVPTGMGSGLLPLAPAASLRLLVRHILCRTSTSREEPAGVRSCTAHPRGGRSEAGHLPGGYYRRRRCISPLRGLRPHGDGLGAPAPRPCGALRCASRPIRLSCRIVEPRGSASARGGPTYEKARWRGLFRMWRPHGDSNPGCRRERAVS